MAGEILVHHEKVEDLSSNTTVQTEVNNIFINQFANATPANTLIAQNQTSQPLTLVFNDGSFEIVLEAKQTITFDKDSKIRYSSLKIKNEQLVQATGKLYLTYGWLYNKFIPADQRE